MIPAPITTRFIVLLIICVLTSLNFSVNCQTYSWVKHYESQSHHFGGKMACAPSGDNYATSSFQGTVNINGEQFEEATSGQLIMKHDGAGTLKWVLPMQGVSITALKATESHVFLAGYYYTGNNYVAAHHFPQSENTSGFVLRMTENGIVDLVIHLTNTGADAPSRIHGMDVDAAGRMYITGFAFPNAVLAGQTLSNNGRPTFIARIDPDGSIGWVTTSNTEMGLTITTSKIASRIFITARVDHTSEVNFDGSSVTYTHSFGGNNPDFGGYILLSCDNSGKVMEVKMLEKGSFRIGWPELELSDYNDLYVVMGHEYENVHILKFDTLMQEVWRISDPDESATVADIAVDVSGNLLLSGAAQGGVSFSGVPLGGTDYSGYVAKYDNHGKLVWVTGALNNTELDGAPISGVDSDSHSDVYINGRFSLPSIFPGYNTLEPMVNGKYDMFVARIRGMSDYESVTEWPNGRLRLYPTVNDGEFIVDLEKKQPARCTISDVSGRCIFTTQLRGDKNSRQIKCILSDGVYFVHVSGSDGFSSQAKMVVRN